MAYFFYMLSMEFVQLCTCRRPVDWCMDQMPVLYAYIRNRYGDQYITCILKGVVRYKACAANIIHKLIPSSEDLSIRYSLTMVILYVNITSLSVTTLIPANRHVCHLDMIYATTNEHNSQMSLNVAYTHNKCILDHPHIAGVKWSAAALECSRDN